MNFNPDSWMDVVAYLIVGVPAIIAAVSALRTNQAVDLARKTHEVANAAQTKTVDAVLDEVKNDHKTNLRDDLDQIRDMIHNGLSDIQQDIREIRSDIRTERVERIEGDRRHK